MIGLVVIEVEIDLLAVQILHRAHAVNALGHGTIGERIGFMGGPEGALGRRQPEDADDEEDGHGDHGQQAQPGIEAKQHRHDAEKQHDVAHRNHGGFEKFLHGIDVALKPAHQPAHLGLVHIGQRDALELGKHGAAHVEQHVFGHLPHLGFLHPGGGEIKQDRQCKRANGPEQAIGVAARHQGGVDGIADYQWNGQLSNGENQHRDDREIDLVAIGMHEGPDAPHRLWVIGLAEDLFLNSVAAHRGTGRTLAGKGGNFALVIIDHAHCAASKSSPGRVCRS